MEPKMPFLLPIVILVAGAIIAGGVYLTRAGKLPAIRADVSLVRGVGADDHLIGNPEAPIKVIEYSDIDCEYCKSFQQSMEQLMTEYGKDGEVAWVYRHFPLVDSHAYAASHAEAAECAASLGNETAFFRFIDALNQAAPGGSQFDPQGYPVVLQSLSIPQAAFDSCMEQNTFLPKVTADFENALASGGTGAPFIVILIQGEEPYVIDGALPYASLKQVIDAARAKIK